MFSLFVRTLLLYLLVFAVLRLMGKRQISDMQPFDLVITLLIADVASVPISDSAVPFLYGVVPILTLFVTHRLAARFALKSNRVRNLVCGKPLVVIAKGVVCEDAMRAADYTLGDLTEQLRIKDVFSLSEVEYGILETNGSLSVLPKKEQPEMRFQRPAVMVLSDGRVMKRSLYSMGYDEKWLNAKLSMLGINCVSNCLFAFLEPDGMLHVQEKQKRGRKPAVHYIKAVE